MQRTQGDDPKLFIPTHNYLFTNSRTTSHNDTCSCLSVCPHQVGFFFLNLEGEKGDFKYSSLYFETHVWRINFTYRKMKQKMCPNCTAASFLATLGVQYSCDELSEHKAEGGTDSGWSSARGGSSLLQSQMLHVENHRQHWNFLGGVDAGCSPLVQLFGAAGRDADLLLSLIKNPPLFFF